MPQRHHNNHNDEAGWYDDQGHKPLGHDGTYQRIDFMLVCSAHVANFK